MAASNRWIIKVISNEGVACWSNSHQTCTFRQ